MQPEAGVVGPLLAIAFILGTAKFRSLSERSGQVPASTLTNSVANDPTDGVIGQPACRLLANVGAALQADGGTRSAFAASSIRWRSAAWTILLDWTYQSRRQVSALWMTRAGSCEK